MIDQIETLASKIDARFGEQVERCASSCRELTYEVDKDDLIKVATALRNEAEFGFEMLIDVCGVDFLNYGSDEWVTNSATGTGFSRGVERKPVILDEADEFDPNALRLSTTCFQSKTIFECDCASTRVRLTRRS